MATTKFQDSIHHEICDIMLKNMIFEFVYLRSKQWLGIVGRKLAVLSLNTNLIGSAFSAWNLAEIKKIAESNL